MSLRLRARLFLFFLSRVSAAQRETLLSSGKRLSQCLCVFVRVSYSQNLKSSPCLRVFVRGFLSFLFFCPNRLICAQNMVKIVQKAIKWSSILKIFDYENLAQDLFVPEIVNLISEIHEHKGKQELYIASEHDILKSMLEIARIQSTGASNRIEGIYTSDKRLEELVKAKAEPRNCSEQEIAGYREVLATIHENYDYMSVRPNILLQLHRDLHAFRPSAIAGRWKSSDNLIEETDAEGVRRTRFKPASAFDTPEYVRALSEAFIAAISREKYDPLLLIPVFVLDFLAIHPFNDGNGRMSRLLTLLLLYKAGYLVGKYVSIEMIIEKTKESYYEALYQSSLGWHENQNSYVPFAGYYLGVILSAYREFEQRVKHLQYRKLSKPDRIRNLFVSRLEKLSKQDIAVLCPDISLSTIESTLHELTRAGFIIKTGRGRSTAY